MDNAGNFLTLIRDLWYLEAGIIAIAIFVYRGFMNSKQNRTDIERHENEIRDIQKSLNHLNKSYSKQETQIEQLLDISKETRDEVRQLITKLIS